MEFDELRFEVPELPLGHADRVVDARDNPGRLALTVFTSNAAARQSPMLSGAASTTTSALMKTTSSASSCAAPT